MKKVIQQFVDVWKLDFLARFVATEHRNISTTVIFWIVSQVVIAVIMGAQVMWFFASTRDDVVHAFDTYIPQDASMRIVDDRLMIDNVQMPFFREINAQNPDGGQESFAIIIDTDANTYSLNSLDAYAGGVIFLQDRAYFKDGTELDQMLYADVPEFDISKDQIMTFVREKYIFPIAFVMTIAVILLLSIGLIVFRAIMALWWSLMLYVIAVIADVRISYAKAYRATLHIYIIPAIAVLITGVVGVNVPYMPSVLFFVIFVANVIWMRNNRLGQEETVENDTVSVVGDVPKIDAVESHENKK